MTGQQITSAAQLDALPVGSVILDREEIAWQKCDDTDRRDDGYQPPTVWASPHYLVDYLSDELAGRLPTPAGQVVAPFTVLYRPDEPIGVCLAEGAVDRVRKLHYSGPLHHGDCDSPFDGHPVTECPGSFAYCEADGEYWPCPTIVALDGAE